MKFNKATSVLSVLVIGGTIALVTNNVHTEKQETKVASKQVVEEEVITEEIIEKTIEAKLRIAEEEERKIQLAKEEAIRNIHFNPYDVTEVSNLSLEHINQMLEGTALQYLAEDYLALEQQYNLNALFIISLTIEESGWGTSNVAINNLNISGQRINGVYRTFNSWEACLIETFRLISHEYVNPNGKYYVGSKNIRDVNLTYCPEGGYSWSNNIIQISHNLRDKLEVK